MSTSSQTSSVEVLDEKATGPSSNTAIPQATHHAIPRRRISFRARPILSPSSSSGDVHEFRRSSSGIIIASPSMPGFSSESPSFTRRQRRSTRLLSGTVIEKPWLDTPDRATRARWLIYGAILMGFGLAAMICYFYYLTVPHVGKLCLVLQDDFSTFDNSVWSREVQLGGFGNGEFEWTTDSDKNAFVQDGHLYIVPTLTNDVLSMDQMLNGHTVNLTADGTCTSTVTSNCVISSNSTKNTVINPVQSARLTTKQKVGITYGKVEVTAKMPKGDWIWPAIWMLPTDNKYGEWPSSGEIDLAESRGNAMSYLANGINTLSSSLHWGPVTGFDRWYWTTGTNVLRRADYTEYHTFGLEWTPDYLMTYIDSRVQQVIHLNFKGKSFWKRGNFPAIIQNGTEQVSLSNPWFSSGNNSAPFDQEFYLILSVAVGGTNGWFPDDVGKKPWVNQDKAAQADFLNATDTWYKTWPTEPAQRGMGVKSVKMWQSC